MWDDVWSEKPEGGELTVALVRQAVSQARSPGKLRKALATQGAAGTTPSLECPRGVFLAFHSRLVAVVTTVEREQDAGAGVRVARLRATIRLRLRLHGLGDEG